MTALDESRWPLHGDPGRLTAAAAVLRTGARPPVGRLVGDHPGFAVARLLDALAAVLRARGDVLLGHEVISAATEIAEHVLDYAAVPCLASDDEPGDRR